MEWRHNVEYEKIIFNVMASCCGKTNTNDQNNMAPPSAEFAGLEETTFKL
jgi:hypothetical protein